MREFSRQQVTALFNFAHRSPHIEIESSTCHMFTKRIVGLSPMTTKMNRAVVPLMTLLALTTQVAAQDLPVLGQGNLPCNSWTERRAGDAVDAATMIAWALGYMTAYNEYGAKPKGDVSGGQHTEELAKWIDEYCRKNPSDSFYAATGALIRKLRNVSSP
jgi:hypothetical protein